MKLSNKPYSNTRKGICQDVLLGWEEEMLREAAERYATQIRSEKERKGLNTDETGTEKPENSKI